MIRPADAPLTDPGGEAAEPALTVRLHEKGGAIVLAVSGDVDLLTGPQLHDSVMTVLEGHPHMLVVDLAAVSLSEAVPQSYFGPIVLITDARCYSAADIFAAGFQDNRIGTILGVDGNTGVGGGQIWKTADLLGSLPSAEDFPLRPAARRRRADCGHPAAAAGRAEHRRHPAGGVRRGPGRPSRLTAVHLGPIVSTFS